MTVAQQQWRVDCDAQAFVIGMQPQWVICDVSCCEVLVHSGRTRRNSKGARMGKTRAGGSLKEAGSAGFRAGSSSAIHPI